MFTTLRRLLGAPAPRTTHADHPPTTTEEEAPMPETAAPEQARVPQFTDLPIAPVALELIRQTAAALGQASLGKTEGLSAASNAMRHLAMALETGVDPRKPTKVYPPEIVAAHRALRGAFDLSQLETMDPEERRIRERYADPGARRQLADRYFNAFQATATDPVIMHARLKRHDEQQAEARRQEAEQARQRAEEHRARVDAARAALDAAKVPHAGLNDAEAMQMAALVAKGAAS